MKQNDYDEAFASFWNSFGSGRHMVLSTVCSDHVSSRMMSVVNIDGCLYFQTFRTSRKYEQMKENAHVALCCDNIQIEGSAEEAGHPLDNPAFCTAFREKYPSSYDYYTSLECEVLYRVRVSRIERWVYKDGRPFLEVFVTDRKIHTVEEQEYRHS